MVQSRVRKEKFGGVVIRFFFPLVWQKTNLPRPCISLALVMAQKQQIKKYNIDLQGFHMKCLLGMEQPTVDDTGVVKARWQTFGCFSRQGRCMSFTRKWKLCTHFTTVAIVCGSNTSILRKTLLIQGTSHKSMQSCKDGNVQVCCWWIL